jgi:hypothetical protein
VLIHGQFLRSDQVDSLKRLGIMPSLFPMHTFYWGDWHRDHTVGPELADDISPTGWCVQRGIKFSSHHDAPVAFPDSMRILDATVTRRSRSGDIIGPAQRVDVLTALKAMTIWPAWQHFEEAQGLIEPGKLADFVILSADPTAVLVGGGQRCATQHQCHLPAALRLVHHARGLDLRVQHRIHLRLAEPAMDGAAERHRVQGHAHRRADDQFRRWPALLGRGPRCGAVGLGRAARRDVAVSQVERWSKGPRRCRVSA